MASFPILTNYDPLLSWSGHWQARDEVASIAVPGHLGRLKWQPETKPHSPNFFRPSTSPCILAHAKSKIGPDHGGFSYTLELMPMPGRTDINAPVVVWGESIDLTARGMLAAAETTGCGEV